MSRYGIRYSIRRTIAGWLVTTPNDGYTFAPSHAAAIEQVAAYEVSRLGGWDWWPRPVPGAVYLVNAHTGATHRFHNHQQAALFLTALQHRKAAA
ncbi:hypothetical protein OVA14_07070 [Agrococcus sp. SL85]|uniref:hypothetical protein n=1 Tax=Agrococcus sp. SL85 TaxID=2995141 RepID=UPI00226CB335|nr:hypothetical protein [Agrococcus sp. SL85]WAC65154.1 hypothetical protein OVA14_07070 [Agrococcus sp. SL85]